MHTIRSAIAALPLSLIFLFISPLASADPVFPSLSGRIVDDAYLISPADKIVIEDELKSLEKISSDQLVVYTATSLQGYSIEYFGLNLGRTWGVGQKGKDNGVLLIVAATEGKVRIEVGRGLEQLLTNDLAKIIIETAILPSFKRGDFSAGIKAGVHDIRDVLLGEGEAIKSRVRTAPAAPSPE